MPSQQQPATSIPRSTSTRHKPPPKFKSLKVYITHVYKTTNILRSILSLNPFLPPSLFAFIIRLPDPASFSSKQPAQWKTFYGGRITRQLANNSLKRSKADTALPIYLNERLGWTDPITGLFHNPLNQLIEVELKQSFILKVGPILGPACWLLLQRLLNITYCESNTNVLVLPPGPLDWPLSGGGALEGLAPNMNSYKLSESLNLLRPLMDLKMASAMDQKHQTLRLYQDGLEKGTQLDGEMTANQKTTQNANFSPEDKEDQLRLLNDNLQRDIAQNLYHDLLQHVVHNYLQQYANNFTQYHRLLPFPELNQSLPAHLQLLFDPSVETIANIAIQNPLSTSSNEHNIPRVDPRHNPTLSNKRTQPPPNSLQNLQNAAFNSPEAFFTTLMGSTPHTLLHFIFTYAYILNSLHNYPSLTHTAPKEVLEKAQQAQLAKAQQKSKLSLLSPFTPQATPASQPDQDEPSAVQQNAPSALNLLSFFQLEKKKPSQFTAKTQHYDQCSLYKTYNGQYEYDELLYATVDKDTFKIVNIDKHQILDEILSSPAQTTPPPSTSSTPSSSVARSKSTNNNSKNTNTTEVGCKIIQISTYGYFIRVDIASTDTINAFPQSEFAFPQWVCVHPQGPIAAYYEANKVFAWKLSTIFSSLFQNPLCSAGLTFSLTKQPNGGKQGKNGNSSHNQISTQSSLQHPVAPLFPNVYSTRTPLTLFHAIISEVTNAMFKCQKYSYNIPSSVIFHALYSHSQWTYAYAHMNSRLLPFPPNLTPPTKLTSFQLNNHISQMLDFTRKQAIENEVLNVSVEHDLYQLHERNDSNQRKHQSNSTSATNPFQFTHLPLFQTYTEHATDLSTNNTTTNITTIDNHHNDHVNSILSFSPSTSLLSLLPPIASTPHSTPSTNVKTHSNNTTTSPTLSNTHNIASRSSNTTTALYNVGKYSNSVWQLPISSLTFLNCPISVYNLTITSELHKFVQSTLFSDAGQHFLLNFIHSYPDLHNTYKFLSSFNSSNFHIDTTAHIYATPLPSAKSTIQRLSNKLIAMSTQTQTDNNILNIDALADPSGSRHSTDLDFYPHHSSQSTKMTNNGSQPSHSQQNSQKHHNLQNVSFSTFFDSSLGKTVDIPVYAQYQHNIELLGALMMDAILPNKISQSSYHTLLLQSIASGQEVVYNNVIMQGEQNTATLMPNYSILNSIRPQDNLSIPIKPLSLFDHAISRLPAVPSQQQQETRGDGKGKAKRVSPNTSGNGGSNGKTNGRRIVITSDGSDNENGENNDMNDDNHDSDGIIGNDDELNGNDNNNGRKGHSDGQNDTVHVDFPKNITLTSSLPSNSFAVQLPNDLRVYSASTVSNRANSAGVDVSNLNATLSRHLVYHTLQHSGIALQAATPIKPNKETTGWGNSEKSHNSLINSSNTLNNTLHSSKNTVFIPYNFLFTYPHSEIHFTLHPTSYLALYHHTVQSDDNDQNTSHTLSDSQVWKPTTNSQQQSHFTNFVISQRSFAPTVSDTDHDDDQSTSNGRATRSGRNPNHNNNSNPPTSSLLDTTHHLTQKTNQFVPIGLKSIASSSLTLFQKLQSVFARLSIEDLQTQVSSQFTHLITLLDILFTHTHADTDPSFAFPLTLPHSASLSPITPPRTTIHSYSFPRANLLQNVTPLDSFTSHSSTSGTGSTPPLLLLRAEFEALVQSRNSSAEGAAILSTFQYPNLPHLSHLDGAETVDETPYRQWLMKHHGLAVFEEVGDGNCLFRTISRQLFGHDSYYVILRCLVSAQLTLYQDLYSFFCFDTSIDVHLWKIAHDREWGDNMELKAISDLFGVTIHVFSPQYYTERQGFVEITPNVEQGMSVSYFSPEFENLDEEAKVKYADNVKYPETSTTPHINDIVQKILENPSSDAITHVGFADDGGDGNNSTMNDGRAGVNAKTRSQPADLHSLFETSDDDDDETYLIKLERQYQLLHHHFLGLAKLIQDGDKLKHSSPANPIVVSFQGQNHYNSLYKPQTISNTNNSATIQFTPFLRPAGLLAITSHFVAWMHQQLTLFSQSRIIHQCIRRKLATICPFTSTTYTIQQRLRLLIATCQHELLLQQCIVLYDSKGKTLTYEMVAAQYSNFIHSLDPTADPLSWQKTVLSSTTALQPNQIQLAQLIGDQEVVRLDYLMRQVTQWVSSASEAVNELVDVLATLDVESYCQDVSATFADQSSNTMVNQ